MESFYDVVVVGGGPAGMSAAVASARAGAKTAIIERYGYLGGQATGGLVILIVGLSDGKERIIKGICEETIDRLFEMGQAKDVGRHVLFDPESMKYLFDRLIEETGVRPYYHSYATGAIMQQGKVCGINIAGKSGIRTIRAKMFVDATGDADLAQYCGIPFDQAAKDKALPVTLGFRVGGLDVTKARQNLKLDLKIGGWIATIHNNEAWFNIANIENTDITDPDDLTKAEITGRRQIQEMMKEFKDSVPGFENAYLIDTASQIGVRDSRRIKGKYLFTAEDVTKRFEDTICLAPDYTGSGRGYVEVPFSCLVSEHIENVIFAGRCISVEHKLLDMFREIPCCMATGQAAGVAAAVGINNIKKIQDILTRQFAMISYS